MSASIIAQSPTADAPRWSVSVASALAARLRQFLGFTKREYFEPDPFSTEQPFVGDDLT
jgi:hypothetical protein